jgi:hypothetical protein
MAGFFVPGAAHRSAMANLAGQIVDVLKAGGYAVDARVYVDRGWGRAASAKALSNPGTARGNSTLTYQVIRQSTARGAYDTIWVVTDNVIDTGSDKASNRDLNGFYKYLRSEAVSSVDLLLMRMQFKGTIYPRSGRSYSYTKRRALVVYGLGLSPSTQELRDEAVQGLGRALANKPYSAKLIRAKPLLEPQQIRFSIVQVPESTPLSPGEQAMRLEVDGAGGQVLSFPVAVEPGSPLLGAFGVEFEPNSGPVVLGDIPIKAEILKRFDQGDLKAEGWSAEVTPPRVTVGGLDAKTNTVVVHLSIDGGIRLGSEARTLGERVLALLRLGLSDQDSAQLTGAIQIVLQPSAGGTRSLDTAFLGQWSTSSERDQTRVYKLDGLFVNVSEPSPQDVPQTKDIGVVARFQYPWWSAFILVIPIIALAGLAWLAAVLARRPVPFRVGSDLDGEWTLQEIQQADEDTDWDVAEELKDLRIPAWKMATSGYSLADQSGAVVGRIKRVPLMGWTATAASGYLVNGRQSDSLGARISPPRRFAILESSAAGGSSAMVASNASGSDTYDSDWTDYGTPNDDD